MKIKYKNSIVGFIDVLGFSKLVYTSEHSHIEAYFNYVVDDLKIQLTGTNFKYLLISDSIVISAPNILSNFKILVKLLSKIQAKLLAKGILLRGAIAVGYLYVNRTNNVIVGSGLIRAYELESSAIYPRIVIDRKFIPLYYGSTNRMIDDSENWLTSDVVNKYADGVIYINYPRYVVIHNTFYMRNRIDNILTMLKEHYYSNTYFEKYDWLLLHLICQFNLSIKEFSEESNPTKQSKRKIQKIKNVLPQFLEI
ncbi:MAG: hypothetical protein V3U87_18250 [Methylococcaceae bacterium]